jgi:CRISPR system Cascade subunit CasC
MEAALERTPGYDRAWRTRKPFDLLATHLTEHGFTEDEARHAGRVVFGAYLAEEKSKKDKQDDGPADASNVLLFLTNTQYADLAAIAAENKDAFLACTPGKEDKEFKAHRRALDAVIKHPRGLISMFGRMIAELPSANVEAGVQIAHAFTVHESAPEFDYFTAVDDYTHEDATGAGHLGTAEFTTGTFYRYATVDLHTLLKNTKSNGTTTLDLATASADDLAVVRGLASQFLLSFAQSLPSSKSTMTAANTRPNLIVISIRNDAPLSYAAAFETPVRHRGNGYLQPAVRQVTEHATLIADAYDDTPAWIGHLNAATTNEETIGLLTSAFGQRVSGGLSALVAAALDNANLPAPTSEQVA